MLNLETVFFIGFLNELAEREANGCIRLKEVERGVSYEDNIVIDSKYDVALGGYRVVKSYEFDGETAEPTEFLADEEMDYAVVAVKEDSEWVILVRFIERKTAVRIHGGKWEVDRKSKLEREEKPDPYRSVEEFFKEENRYRGGIMDKDLYDELCERYGFVKAHCGWEKTDEMAALPDTDNRSSLINGPDIRRYFDHKYTFRTADDEMYWVVCPYLKGGYADNLSAVKGLFEANALECKIHKGFYNKTTATIVLKPEDVLKAYEE